jgi:hypothetical protein
MGEKWKSKWKGEDIEKRRRRGDDLLLPYGAGRNEGGKERRERAGARKGKGEITEKGSSW